MSPGYLSDFFFIQHPGTILDLVASACLQCVRREEVKTLFNGGDDDPHEAVIETLHLNSSPKALRDGRANTVSGLWTAVLNYSEAVPDVLRLVVRLSPMPLLA